MTGITMGDGSLCNKTWTYQKAPDFVKKKEIQSGILNDCVVMNSEPSIHRVWLIHSVCCVKCTGNLGLCCRDLEKGSLQKKLDAFEEKFKKPTDYEFPLAWGRFVGFQSKMVLTLFYVSLSDGSYEVALNVIFCHKAFASELRMSRKNCMQACKIL